MDSTLLIVASLLGLALLLLLGRLVYTIQKKRQLLRHAKHIYVSSLGFLGHSEEEDVAILVARNGFYAGIVLEKKIHHHFLRSLRTALGGMDEKLLDSFAYFERLR